MPVTMAENRVKGFIIMNKLLAIVLAFVAGLIAISSGCKKNKSTEIIPTAPVNQTIDLSLPAYYYMVNPGNVLYLTGGVKGVILVHDFDDNWYAFERTCGYQPLNNCSQIWYDTTSLNFRCGTYTGNVFTKCCDSKYFFNGLPAAGPSVTRLASYRLQKSGNVITVY